MHFLNETIHAKALASVSKFFRRHFDKLDGEVEEEDDNEGDSRVDGQDSDEDEGDNRFDTSRYGFDTAKYLPKVNCCDFGDMLQLAFPDHERRHEWHHREDNDRGLTGVKILILRLFDS